MDEIGVDCVVVLMPHFNAGIYLCKEIEWWCRIHRQCGGIRSQDGSNLVGSRQ